MKRVSLHQPRLTEMEYRQALLSQPETMAYNRDRDLEAESYHRDTGCIDFPRADWRYWRQVWLLNEPDFFSAYIRDNEKNCFVGEVCYFYDAEAQAHIAGVLIEACHRGKGYCAEALRALIDHAFHREDIGLLRCDIVDSQVSALAGYRRAGFHVFDRKDGLCALIYTREDYERSKSI